MTGFIDIEDRGLPIPQGLKGQQYLDKVQAMQIGSGAKVFRGDESGIWLGAKKFADAPFSVDMLGNVVASSGAIKGNITVGGAANASGVIHVLNSSEVEKVTIDKDGILIQDGKLVIKDSTNTTIMDATGLVSAASFSTEEVEQTVEKTTSSTSFVDISGVTMTFSLSRNTKILFLFAALMYKYGGAVDSNILVSLTVDGTNYRPWLIFWSDTNESDNVETVSAHKTLTLGSGSHTAKLQFKSGNANYTAAVDEIILTRVNLGT